MHFDVETDQGEQKQVVLKPINNAQGAKVPVNELVVTELAFRMGLPVNEPLLVDVPSFIASNVHLYGRQDCLQPGYSFAVPKIIGQTPPTAEHVANADNDEQLVGMVAFDTWVANTDRANDGNVMGGPSPDNPGKYRIWMLDHGHCITGPAWTAQSLAQCLAVSPTMYLPVLEPGIQRGLHSLSRWASAIETVVDADLTEIVNGVPPGWLSDQAEQQALLEFLGRRRSQIRPVLGTRFAVTI